MNGNDAGRIISVIDGRIERNTQSEAKVETTWGEVCGVSADGKMASAYLYGSEYASEGFRLPGTMSVVVGDKVKVAWDDRGDRWVVDVAIPTPFKKLAIRPSTGEILSGDGQHALVPTGDLFVVYPGFVIYDDSPPSISVHSEFGVDSDGHPYMNLSGVASGDEAALLFNPATGNFVLRRYAQ